MLNPVHAVVAVRCRLRDAAIGVYGRLVRLGDEAGQTVAEYAIVLLVAAAIAGTLLVWAKQSGRLDAFFDAIFARLLESVDPEATPTPAP